MLMWTGSFRFPIKLSTIPIFLSWLNCSLSSLESMRDVMDLLGDMLQAVDPSDRAVWISVIQLYCGFGNEINCFTHGFTIM